MIAREKRGDAVAESAGGDAAGVVHQHVEPARALDRRPPTTRSTSSGSRTSAATNAAVRPSTLRARPRARCARRS